MNGLSFKQKLLVGGVLAALLLACITGINIHRSALNADKVYAAALDYLKNGDYSNAYYKFSKVSFLSNLKPVAIYHQGQAASELGDKNAAIKQYQLLFNNYPKHALSVRAKYLTAQEIVFDNPKLAHKYFEELVNKYPHTDYGIASEYYLGVLLINKYHDNEDQFPMSEKINAENYFRHYLKKAPSGRLAINACENWLGLNVDINKDDYLLMAKSYYLFGDYAKAKSLLSKTELAESWTTDVLVSYALKDYSRVKSVTELGLREYSGYVSEDNLIVAVDKYLSLSDNTLNTVMKLIAMNPQKGNDYLLSIKCRNVKDVDKPACYSDLYIKYPSGNYSADALSNIFFEKYLQQKYNDAEKIGQDYLKKFPDANSTPMVMFWMGKLYEKINDYRKYNTYYTNVISKYPDSYYAYRAYLHLNRYQNSPIITNYITPQPVTYPYKYTRKNIVVKLVELKDFDVIGELWGDDEFIKSWVLYQKGDYAHSMLVARDAMEKIKDKPDKYDLRWRLVYPVNFYETVEKYSDLAGTSLPLILSIIREESYFDPLAQSAAGASGLMQLMPSTAWDVNHRYGLGMTSSDDLFNAAFNIKLGNYYYALLKSLLDGKDISSVAAYNGGIGSLTRWKQSINYNDTDEFVEQIPYSETQNYVKKVFRTYWNYVRLYTGNQ